MTKYLSAAATGAILLAFSAADASAAYACNGNVCWVIKERHTYPAESKVIIREETWKPSADIVIRTPREGRGYYVGTEWRTW